MFEDVLCYAPAAKAGSTDEKVLREAWKNEQRRMEKRLLQKSHQLRGVLIECDRVRAETGEELLGAYLKATAGLAGTPAAEDALLRKSHENMLAWKRALAKIRDVPAGVDPLLAPEWTALSDAAWDPSPAVRAERMSEVRREAEAREARLALATEHAEWVMDTLPVLAFAMKDTLGTLALVRKESGDDPASYSETGKYILRRARELALVTEKLVTRRLGDPGGAGKEAWADLCRRTETAIRGGIAEA